MSTEDATAELKTSQARVENNVRTEKLKHLRNQIKSGTFAIMDKNNKGFEMSCKKVAERIAKLI